MVNGNLDLSNVLVQQALLETDKEHSFKENLVKLCKEEDEKEKEDQVINQM